MPEGNSGGATVGPPTGNSGGAVVGPSPEPTSGGAIAGGVMEATTVDTGTQINLLGGLISPATIEEARPSGGRGSAVSSFLLRRLAKAERDIANLKAAQ